METYKDEEKRYIDKHRINSGARKRNQKVLIVLTRCFLAMETIFQASSRNILRISSKSFPELEFSNPFVVLCESPAKQLLEKNINEKLLEKK